MFPVPPLFRFYLNFSVRANVGERMRPAYWPLNP